MNTIPDTSQRHVIAANLIGSSEAAAILKVTKPTLTRRVAAGKMTPLARLDNGRGALVFDREAIEQQAGE